MYLRFFARKKLLLTWIIVLVFLKTQQCFASNDEKSCPPATFKCDSGICINGTLVCDNIYDCTDGSDEKDCEDLCPEGWFHCLNGNCILRRWRCDNENDCGDHSDELNCGQISATCSHNEFRCHDNSKCIPLNWVCDGNQDCKDASDEVPGCARRVPCDGFECQNRQCVPRRWHCDGMVDCDDASDEKNCSHKEQATSCLESNLKFYCEDRSECLSEPLVCNGIKNCDDGSDEGGQCDERTCKTAACSHECFQTPKAAVCYCPSGYELDGTKCKDVDECAGGPGRPCSHKCANSIGSYTCSCVSGYELQKDKKTCKLNDPEPILVYSTSHNLKYVKLRTGLSYTIHEGLGHAVGVDYDSKENRIYWTEISDGSEAIKNSRLDGRDVKFLVTTGISVVEDVAFDWIGRNIYFIDSGLQRLVVCTEDGLACHILFKNLRQPRSLVSDPIIGMMFWTDWSDTPSIERSNMDGLDHRELATADLGWPNGLTLDYLLQCIYWVDGKLRRVESIDLDGKNRHVVMEQVMVHPFSLAVLEDTLYWTDWSRHTLESCNKFTGENHTVLIKEEGDVVPMGLRAYHPVLQPTFNNPCWRNPCSQMCLVAPQARYRCVCQVGFQSSNDGKSCARNATARVFLWVEENIYRFDEAIIGRSSLAKLQTKAKSYIGAMTYDHTTDRIIYSDTGSKELVVVDLKTEKQTTLSKDHVDMVQGLAIDWIAGNLYWTDTNRKTLEVSRSDGRHRQILVGKLQGSPMGIALMPQKGFMFIAITGDNPRIEKLDMDATDRHVFLDYEMHSPSSLTIDYSADRLYWVDSGSGKLEWVSLDGKRRFAMKNYGGWPSSVSLSSDRIWWMDSQHDAVLWMDKASGSTASSFDLRTGHSGQHNNGLLIVDTVPLSGSSGCAVANGHCSHLCLVNQRSYVCDCPLGMQISQDHRTCEAESECNSHEFACANEDSCIPLTFTCDTIKDCKDGSDEMNCPRQSCTSKEFKCNDGRCVPLSWKCDRRQDCTDNSDETDCANTTTTCPSGMFTCRSGECINGMLQCDGEADCSDKSDETSCTNTCASSEYRCKSEHCIPSTWKCDGEVDCHDGSDEGKECKKDLRTCNYLEFTCDNGRCVEKDLVCDQDDDCGDNSDEKNCENRKSCPSNMVRCGNTSKCVLAKAVCDGIKDCPKGEDEAKCKEKSCQAEEFICPRSKICIPKSWLCDGDNDCDDNADENRPECHYEKTTLGQTDLRPGHDLVYTSSQTVSKCSDHQYQCTSGECISLAELCNHKKDCKDGSDEGSFCETSCAKNNGDCSDICLPTPKGPKCWCREGYHLGENLKKCRDMNECIFVGICSHTCVNLPGTFLCKCASGYQLKSDHRSCKAEGAAPYLLVAFANKLLSYTLGGNHVHVIAESTKTEIKDMDFDAKTGDVYWINDEGLLWKHSAKTKSHEVFLEGLKLPTALAFDWINRLIFYHDSKGYIVACTLQKIDCARTYHVGARNVANMVLHPRLGYLYWSTWSNNMEDRGTIRRMNMDGRKVVFFASGKVIWPSGLSIDFVLDRLYWIDFHLLLIESARLDGGDRKIMKRKDIFPMHLALFEDRIYWADWGKNAIVDCNKWICTETTKVIENVVKATKVAILHPVQQPAGTTACSHGKCSHICVTVPNGFACLCPEQMKFTDERNTTCESENSQCTKMTCFNGGTCIMQNNQAMCKCPRFFQGNRCQKVTSSKFANDVPDATEGSKSWIAGVVIGILFIMTLAVAVMWYCRRYEIDKLRGAFARMPFYNPDFDANGEPEEDYNDTTGPNETHRSYSNPLFHHNQGSDMIYNVKEDKVEFHVSTSSTSLDSAFASESLSNANTTLIDLTQKQKLIP